jgi:hypothetical protein
MLSTRSPLHSGSSNGWLRDLQIKIQHWIGQQIINDDPFDEESLMAQKIYEEMRQLQRVTIPIPFQSDAGLRNY